jgi:hypothetical protein
MDRFLWTMEKRLKTIRVGAEIPTDAEAFDDTHPANPFFCRSSRRVSSSTLTS